MSTSNTPNTVSRQIVDSVAPHNDDSSMVQPAGEPSNQDTPRANSQPTASTTPQPAAKIPPTVMTQTNAASSTINVPAPAQLSPSQLKDLIESKQRTAIIFKDSEDAFNEYVFLDYSLPLAQALSSFVRANATRKEAIKIGLPQFVTPQKAVVKIVVGASNCPGFHKKDYLRVKEVFKWMLSYASGDSTTPDFPDGSLLEYIRLQEVAEALGVLVLVQRLAKRVDFITKKFPSATALDEVLSFYSRTSSPAKWQIAVDALVFLANEGVVQEDDEGYLSLARKHPGLDQGVRQTIQQSRQQVQVTRGRAHRGRSGRGRGGRGRGANNRGGHRGVRNQASAAAGGQGSADRTQASQGQAPQEQAKDVPDRQGRGAQRPVGQVNGDHAHPIQPNNTNRGVTYASVAKNGQSHAARQG